MKRFPGNLSVVSLAVFLAACGGGGSGSSSPAPNPPAANIAPSLSVALTHTVQEREQITINTTAADSDGTINSVEWVHSSGPIFTVISSSNTSLVIEAPEVLSAGDQSKYKVIATDNDGATTVAEVTVDIENVNQSPISAVPNNVSVTVGNSVALDGSASSDPDGQIAEYSWSVVSPANSQATIASGSLAQTTFTPDLAGEYVITLSVEDNEGLNNSASFTVVADVVNLAPIANAGADVSVPTGSTVTLNSSASVDPEGDSLSYTWVLTPASGSSSELSDATVASPTFIADVDGQYTASLVVSDSVLTSTADSVTITAQTANVAPVANAGVDMTVASGEIIQLNGSASADADNDSLTYAWTLVSSPVNSMPMLSNAAVAEPTVTTDLVGNYVYRLTVSDGEDSSSDNVSIDVIETSVTLCALGSGEYPAENCLRYPWGGISTSSLNKLFANGDYVLDRLRIKARGIAYTINITAEDTSGISRPFIGVMADGEVLANGQAVVEAGQDFDFNLQGEPLAKDVATPKYTVSVEVAGEEDLIYNFNYNVNIQ